MAVVLDVTDQLKSALDVLAGADPARLADPETIVELHRQLERLNGAVTRAASAFEAGRAWEDDGARSASAWLGLRCAQPVVTARRRLRLGRALRSMPAAEAAWLVGDIFEAHVSLLAAAAPRPPPSASSVTRRCW